MLKRIFLISLVSLFSFSGIAFAQGKLKVTTTLTIFGDLSRQIGKDYLEVSSLCPAKFNPHFYEPKPSDVLRTQKADLFIHAGLDLELWRFPLVDAAGNPDIFPGGKKELDMSKGIKLLEAPGKQTSRLQGDIHLYGNPHYWLAPRNAAIMAGNICAKLKELDPGHSDYYESNLNDFLKTLDEKIAFWNDQLVPVKDKEIFAYHNEWVYFVDFAGLYLSHYLEPKPGIPPTPKQLEFLENYAKANNVKVIIMPTFFPKDAAETLAKRIAGKVVILCQNLGEVPETNDIFGFFDYNFKQITLALQ